MAAPLALVRPFGDELARCELSFRPRTPVDVARARAQHAAHLARLAELGCEVRPLAPLSDHPDAAFVEDVALALADVLVLLRPGAASRRGEVESVARELDGLRPTLRMEAPATMDGGDVVDLGELVLVGRTRRTSHAGLRWLAHALLAHGRRVKAVEVRDALHLRTVCSPLDEETLLVDPARVDLARAAGVRTLAVHPAEPDGANALRLGEVVLLSASAPRTAERVAAAGYRVELAEIDELEKAEAGLTCLSLRVPR